MSTINKRRIAGFTLIELLVVISIVSLLSSVVLASLRTARVKAAVAAGQLADRAVYSELADATLIFEWRFERATCSGACTNGATMTLLPNSGEAGSVADLTIYSGAPGYSTETPLQGSASGLFQSSERFNRNFAFPTALRQPSGFTISFWMKSSATNIPELYADGHVLITKSNSVLNLYPFENGSWILRCSAPQVGDNEWHHVIATFNATASQIFLDGKPSGTGCSGSPNWKGYSAALGYYNPSYVYIPSPTSDLYMSRIAVFGAKFK